MTAKTAQAAQLKVVPSQDGIRLDGGRNVIIVERLEIVDAAVVKHFKSLPTEAWEDEFLRLVAVGGAVVERVQTSTDVDFIENRVQQLMTEVESSLDTMRQNVVKDIDSRIDPAEKGSHAARITELVDAKKSELVTDLERIVEGLRRDESRLRHELTERFDPDSKTSYLGRLGSELAAFEQRIKATFDSGRNDSVPALFKSYLEKAFGNGGQLSTVLEQHLSLGNDLGPLAQIHREITTLREEIAARRAAEEVIEKSPAKGLTFEERVEATLEAAAQHFTGDYVEDVRNVASRKGDYLYHLAEGTVIGIEARDRKINSAAKVRQELDEILRERSADYAIYVVSCPSQLQNQMGDWDEYGGNRVVTSVELLPLTLKFARLRLRASTEADVVDLQTITVQISSIRDTLKKAGRIKAEARSSEKASLRVLDVVQDLEDSIRASLTAMEDALVTREE